MLNFFKNLDKDKAREQNPGYQLWKADNHTIRFSSDPYLALSAEERMAEAERKAQSFTNTSTRWKGEVTRYDDQGEIFWNAWEMMAQIGGSLMSTLEAEERIYRLLYAEDDPETDAIMELEVSAGEPIMTSTVSTPLDDRGIYSLHATGSIVPPVSLR